VLTLGVVGYWNPVRVGELGLAFEFELMFDPACFIGVDGEGILVFLVDR
jgi:hypothetical protein